MCGDETADLVVQYPLLVHGYECFDLLVVVEAVQQRLMYRFVHPVFGLLASFVVEVSVLLRESDIVGYHLPYLGNAGVFDRRARLGVWFPSAVGGREQSKCVLETYARGACAFHITTVALVDSYTVSHLHYSSFDTLQFVACAGHLQQQEEVHHRVCSGLRLSDANGLDEYGVEPGSLAQHDRLARLACHTAERAG